MSARTKRPITWILAVSCLVVVAACMIFLKADTLQSRAVGAQPATPEPQALALTIEPSLPPSVPAYSPPGPDLVGRVTSTNGEPVPGAVILIDVAGPRVGRGYT